MHSMQMLTFFGTFCLIFLPIFAFSSDEKLSQDQQCIQPIEYIMNISAEVHNNSLNVNSRVKLNISCTDQKIRLYVKHYCNVIYDFNIITNIPRYNYSHWLYEPFSTKEGFIDIVLKDQYIEDFKIKQRKRDIQPGIYWITSKYNCILEKVATLIPYVPETKKEKYLILPRIPAEWIFPHWKNPAIKAAFTIQFNHTYNEIILSHMVGDKEIEEDHLYTVFRTTPIISTHLVATAVLQEYTDYYNYTFLLYHTRLAIQIRFQVKTDISYAVLLIQKFVTFIDDKKKNTTSVSYVHCVALPINSTNYKTIVTTGLVLFRDANIAYNREVDSIIKQATVTCLIVRGVLQEMFSEWLVTLKQSDSWFLEEFLTFYGVYLVDQLYNETLLKSIAIQTRRVGFEYTQAYIESDVFIQENLFVQNVTYSTMWKEKSFNIFSMINNFFYNKTVLYNSIFEEAIKLYSITKNTSSDTFNEQSILNILWENVRVVPAVHKNNRLKTINIKNVITSWITQHGYPVVQVTRNNDAQSLTIKVIDCIAVIQKELCDHKWWIPVIYVTISKNKSITHHYSYLDQERKDIVVSNIEEDDFIVITEQNGYRVNYDYKFWEKLGCFLKNGEPQNWDMYEVSDVTLAQILDDAFYFLIQNTKYNKHPVARMSNIDTFFNLAGNVLYVEIGYITWYPIFNALQYVSHLFPFPESAKIKDKAIEILNKFLEDTSHINVSENSIDTQLYHEALKWTCILGSSKCKKHLIDILKWHLQNPAQNKLLLSWQKWIYCQGVTLGLINDYMLFFKIQDIYLLQEKPNHFFHLLSCRGHNYKLEVRYAQEHTLGKDNDFVSIFFHIVAKHVKRFSSLDTILSQIQNKFPRPVGLLAVVNFSINHIYLDEDLETITKTVVVMVTNLINRYNLETPLFIHDVIMKKMVKRRRIIRSKKLLIRVVPEYVLHY
ncbi:aminopeptidase N-like isoform X2 [Pseudomyrmex gracilis]|uniref:aminopeptidase N-like isoform X2 n=1 Tax=Pseudomyrmex gracilis TaxID=219809 RepID=UPI0009957D07|nr:aminopeptidase N-like isoform X2 [Pseudomyrmex gracilis]